jgi:nuclear GTP-binding protein
VYKRSTLSSRPSTSTTLTFVDTDRVAGPEAQIRYTMAPHVKSKRVLLKNKHKRIKKVAEHHRQLRKNGKKRAAGPTRANKKADPGIPNSFPLKMEVMAELARKKQLAKEAKAKLALNQREAMTALVANASSRAATFDKATAEHVDIEKDVAAARRGDGSRKAFMGEFKKVVDSADVILEVLDARDPVGCRCLDAERAIMAASSGSKRILLVLNKIDLVPAEVAAKWLTYLRNEFPTVPFRASIQKGNSGGVGQAAVTPLAATDVGTSDCLGAATLLQLLKNYCRSRNLKTSITVGVIGFPNVGKSSLINSLKRTRAVSTGAMPGVTRSAQEVVLDKNIRLLDCPGIVFSDHNADALVLRNSMKIDQIADPVSPVRTILKRIGSEPLMAAYSVPAFDDVVEFLAMVAKMRGKYKRGGALDLSAAAIVVLLDWNNGVIPFYTLPPTGPRRAHISAAVVDSFGTEFDVHDLETKKIEAAELQCLDDRRPQSDFAVAAEADAEEEFDDLSYVDEAEDEVDDMDDSGDADSTVDNDDDDDDAGNEPTYHAAPARRSTRRNPSSNDLMDS